jgi:modulator of FtsH protease HflC
MRKLGSFIVGLLILVILLLSMFTYRVRYNEMVILTTLGKATDQSVRNADGNGAGLYFKLPWPIQDASTVYDARVQLLVDRLEEQQTLDKQSIVASAFVTWRVSEPLKFFRTLNNFTNAERQLRDRLRNARAKIGLYNFDQLHNVDPAKLQLVELEGAMRQQLQADLDAQGYGVIVDDLQIKRTSLAETVTQKVFDRMRADRQKLAESARSEGNAAAADIRSRATSAQQRIVSFAERRAQAIRAEGDAAAADQYKLYAQNQEFAIFLRKIEEYRRILKNNTTFLIDARSGPFDLFLNPPTGELKPAPASGSNTEKKE